MILLTENIQIKSSLCY